MNLIKVVPVLLLFVAVFAFPGKQEKIDSNENKSYLEEIESEFKDEFEDWKRLFKKEYKSFEEEITRFSIWLSNLRYEVFFCFFFSFEKSPENLLPEAWGLG